TSAGGNNESKSKTQEKNRSKTRTRHHRKSTDGAEFLHRWRSRSRRYAGRRRLEDRHEEVARLPSEGSQSRREAASADARSCDTPICRQGAIRYSDFVAEHALGENAHQSPSSCESQTTRRVGGREDAGCGLHTHGEERSEKISFAR